jgi:hypothetical protein
VQDLEILDVVSDARKRFWALEAALDMRKNCKKEVSVAQLVDDANEIYRFLINSKPAKVVKLKTVRSKNPCKPS